MASPNKVKMSWQGNRFLQRVRLGARSGAEMAADILIAEAKRLIITSPKSGRVYWYGPASAPGEPPGNVTGRLLNGFKKKTTVTGTLVTVAVSNNQEHADWLELGTRKMAPRPYMRPAYANSKAAMIEAIGNGIKTEVGKK